MNTVEKKIAELKSLLGDEAAKSALEQAEKREAAAKEAGVEHKEVKTKDEEVEKLTVSQVLADLDAAIQSGEVEDDLGLDQIPVPGDEDSANEPDEADGLDMEEFEKDLAEYIDAKVKEGVAAAVKEIKMGFVPRGKEAEEQRVNLQKDITETQKSLVAMQAQLNELLGVQPRHATKYGFRASQDEKTVTTKEGEKPDEPHPIDQFIGTLLSGGNGA